MSKKVVVRARKKGTNKVVLSDIADVKEKSTSIIEDRGTEESKLNEIEQFSSEEQCAAIEQEPEQCTAIKQEPEQSTAVKQEPEQVEDILQSDLEEQSIVIKHEPEQVENIEQGVDSEQISVYGEGVTLTKNEMQVSDIAILDEDEKGKKSGKSKSLSKAKQKKNDEFYTTYQMIEQELMTHSEYRKYFKGKTILCNCDDPFWSKFYTFFNDVAVKWGIQRLIITTYKETLSDDKVVALDWDRGKDCIISDNTLIPRIYPLQGNGDFASDECIEYLKQSDIVVTNPPFSKVRAYIDLLMKYNKDFVLIVPVNALTYKNVFPYIQQNRIKIGYLFNKTANCHTKEIADTTYNKITASCNICFITTLNLDKRKEDIPLNCLYYGNEEKYPKFDNIDAINVNRVKDIPKDYYGIMGVPITFLGNYSPEQFQIIDGLNRYCLLDTLGVNKDIKAKKSFGTNINGKQTYLRVLIQRRFYLSDDIECNYYNIAIDYCIDYSIGVIETSRLFIENECRTLQNCTVDYTIRIDCIFDNEPKYMYEISEKG